MRKVIGRVLCAALLGIMLFRGIVVYAEESYQVEVSPEYMQIKGDHDFKINIVGINGEAFVAPVKTEGHSYDDAAFLERISSVFFTAARIERKGTIEKSDGMLYGIGVNLVSPGSPFAFNATYANVLLDFKRPGLGDLLSNEYTASLGYFILPTLLAGAEYSYSRTDVKFTGFPSQIEKDSQYGLFGRYVHELRDETGMNFEGDLRSIKIDDGAETFTNTEISLAVDYFFNRSLLTGVAIARNSGEDDFSEGMTYTVRSRVFFLPRYSLEVVYDRFLNANAGKPSDYSIDAALAARF